MNFLPVLHSKDWVFPVSGRTLTLIEDGAGNLRADLIPSEAELSEFYGSHFERSSYSRRGKAMQGWHRAWRLRALLGARGPARVLDYGFGNGQFLRACQRRYRQAELVGFEMTESQCQLLRDLSGAAAFCDWESLSASYPEGFDVITAWHVLEHAPDPAKIMRRLARALKPGGSCLFAVPNREASGMQIRGEKWAWCQAPYIHIWHFSPAGIERLLRETFPGAEVIVTTRDAWDCNYAMDGWLAETRALDRIRPDRARLRIESGLRLASVALNEGILNPFVFPRNRRGSELIAQVRQPLRSDV